MYRQGTHLMNTDPRTDIPREEARGYSNQSVRLGTQDFEVNVAAILGMAFRTSGTKKSS